MILTEARKERTEQRVMLLKESREFLCINGYEAAEEIGVTPATYRKWESTKWNKNIDIKYAPKLKEVLGVDWVDCVGL